MVVQAGQFVLQDAMLSQKAKYAIKALIALARADGKLLQAADIAESQSIPKKFLDLIFFELRGHGMVHSTRGRQGGYSLGGPPENITIAGIIRAVDGALAPLPLRQRALLPPLRRLQGREDLRGTQDHARSPRCRLRHPRQHHPGGGGGHQIAQARPGQGRPGSAPDLQARVRPRAPFRAAKCPA